MVGGDTRAEQWAAAGLSGNPSNHVATELRAVLRQAATIAESRHVLSTAERANVLYGVRLRIAAEAAADAYFYLSQAYFLAERALTGNGPLPDGTAELNVIRDARAAAARVARAHGHVLEDLL